MPHERSPTVWAGVSLRRYLEQLQAAGRIRPGVDLDAATTMFLGTLFTDGVSRDILAQLYPKAPEESIEQYVELFLHALGVLEAKP
jgi:hypothetical protein